MPCECWWNPETGFFEACCEEHEQEYVEYLLKTAREQFPERFKKTEGGDA